MGSEYLGLNLSGSAPDEISPDDKAVAAGLGAGLVSLAVGAAGRFAFRTPFVPERVADFVFKVMPISVVEAGVALLGPYAKRFAFLLCVLGYLAILALLGRLYARWRPKPLLGSGIAFGAGVWLVASVTVFPVIDGGFFGLGWAPGPAPAALALLASGLVYGAAIPLLLERLGESEALARRMSALAGRRAVLNVLATAGVAVVAWELLKSAGDALGIGDDSRVRDGTGVFPDIDGLSREVTPVKDFYHVSKNVFDPDGPPSDWRLEIGGLVERPRVYTLDEIRALPPHEEYATLMCIDNAVGGALIGNARWRGVPLGALLEEAGIAPGAVDVLLTAFDDYTDSIPVDRALDPEALLAYEMNGEPLTATHGAPLRLIVPGIFGMKNVKWLKRIELVDRDVKGYWQRRGWDDSAEYQTMARVDVARAAGVGQPASVAGVAFAGDRGISRVEVSTDGGKTWADAELKPPLGKNAWVLWHFGWTPERPGTYTVVVRATDGTGEVQTDRYSPPAPKGSTGLHRARVTVTG